MYTTIQALQEEEDGLISRLEELKLRGETQQAQALEVRLGSMKRNLDAKKAERNDKYVLYYVLNPCSKFWNYISKSLKVILTFTYHYSKLPGGCFSLLVQAVTSQAENWEPFKGGVD